MMAPTYYGDGDTIEVGGYHVEFTTGSHITHSSYPGDTVIKKYINSGDYLFLGDKTKGFCYSDPSQGSSSYEYLVTGDLLLKDVRDFFCTHYSIPFIDATYKEVYAEVMPYYTACSDFGGYTTPGAEKWILQTKTPLTFKNEAKTYGVSVVDPSQPIYPSYSLVVFEKYVEKIRSSTTFNLDSLDSSPPITPFSGRLPDQLALLRNRKDKTDTSGAIDLLWYTYWLGGAFIASADFPVYLVHKDKVTLRDTKPPTAPVQEHLVEVTDVDIFEVQKSGAMVHIDARDYSIDSTPLYFGFTLPAYIFYKKNIYDYIEAIALPQGGYQLPDLRSRAVYVKQKEPGVRWLTYHPDGNCIQYGCPRCTNLYVRI